MTKEIKIVLPAYKMLYSIAFFVILSLVRSITYTEEIGIAMQAPVAALTAVFCADTYIMEIQSGRREIFRLCDDRKQTLVIYRRLEIQMAYLIAVSVPGYLMFFWQNPYPYGNTLRAELFGITIAVIGVTVFFWGMMSVTVCILLRNQWAGIGISFVLWIGTNSTAGDRLLGKWNVFSFAFHCLGQDADFGWLCGQAVCIVLGAVMVLLTPYIIRKRG